MLSAEWPAGVVPISRSLLASAVKDRLTAAAQPLTVYAGRVDKPPAKATGDSGQRLAPYAIIGASPGSPHPAGEDLADTHLDIDWLVTVTVVAGYENACLAALDRAHHALYRWAPAWPTVTEATAAAVGAPLNEALLSLAGFRPPPGWQPAPLFLEESPAPPTFTGSLQYRTTVTT